MDSLTPKFMYALPPEFFDALVVVVIVIGGALAIVRLYRDFTRPLDVEDEAKATRPSVIAPITPEQHENEEGLSS